MILWTYIRFLSSSLLKKKSIWIFGILYLLFSFLLLIVVPLILDHSPWELWHNVMLNPQSLLMYVMTIFGAIVSIAIFKEYRDDGTELILVTKPINRTKATVAKFVLFFVFAFSFSLLSLINAPFTFIFKDVTAVQVSNLVVSMLFANFIILIIFGMLATLISLFANKIWTILANVILMVILMIISTVSAIVVKTPATLAKNDNHAIVSAEYLGNDNQVHTFAALTPTMEMDEDGGFNISFTNIEEEKAEWNNYCNKSSSGIANLFDLPNQFNLLNNMGSSLEEEFTKDASKGFGSNRFYDYQLQDHILSKNFDYLPSYFVTMPDNFTSIDPELTNLDPSEILQQVLERYFDLISKQTMVVIGTSQLDATSLISMITPNKFKVAEGSNGWSGSKNNLVSYNYDDLKVNNEQKEVFERILTPMLETDDIYNFQNDLKIISSILSGNPYAPSGHDILFYLWDPYFNEEKSLTNIPFFQNVLSEEALEKCSSNYKSAIIYNFIHACLVGANNGETDLDGTDTKTDKSGKYKDVFWSTNNSLTPSQAAKALMKTVAMFQLYTFQKLTKEINNDGMFKYAQNTSTNLSDTNIPSSPVLPLTTTDDAYDMGNPLLAGLDGCIATIWPNYVNSDLYNLFGGTAKWADGSTPNSSYFTNNDILRRRSILRWITYDQKYGYSNAINSGILDSDPTTAFEREKKYNVSLKKTHINFPMIYECLGATYKATPKFESWQLILIWTLIGTILTGISFAIYIRTDFK